jgi:two-component system cell cycle sensor histidine kinase/response regulator CckA
MKMVRQWIKNSNETQRDSESALSTAEPTPSEVILLVEDDTSVRDLVHSVLERHGYVVYAHPEPRSALAFAHANGFCFDLVLTDVVMPEMHGQALMRRLTELQSNPRVLFMSGYFSEAIVQQGILTPGAHFLQKPFTPTELLERVRHVLDEPSMSGPASAA